MSNGGHSFVRQASRSRPGERSLGALANSSPGKLTNLPLSLHQNSQDLKDTSLKKLN